MNKLNMSMQILIATALGILAGVFLGEALQPARIIGDIFLRLIQMSIVVLVFGQITQAVGNINPRTLGKMGVKTIAAFLISSLLAAGWGIGMALLFRPGVGVDISRLSSGQDVAAAHISSISGTILEFFPTNIVSSMSQGTIIQVIVFSILFGIGLGYVVNDEQDHHLLNVVVSANKVIIKMVTLVMKAAPIGVFAIVATTIVRLGIDVIVPLAKYLGVYALGTLIFLIIWLVVVALWCKTSILRLVHNLMDMSILALATTSSAVTLPTALKDTQEKLGVSARIARFVMPLGMSLNSNGAAMHMAITIATIMQIYGIAFGVGGIAHIAMLATLASLANAVVPGAGLVSLTIVVPAMGLPLESVALFAGVDWFVGMLRTILNVDADALCCMLVAKSEKELDYAVFNGAENRVMR